MFAIVDIAGQQFKVEKGKSYFVHRLNNAVDAKVSFDKVLLLYNESDIRVGTPLLEDVAVDAKVLEHLKGEKVIVFKKKRRKGYRVKNGHRQCFTRILVEDIVLGVVKTAEETAPKKKTSAKKEVVVEQPVIEQPVEQPIVEQPVEVETVMENIIVEEAAPKKRKPAAKKAEVEQPAEEEVEQPAEAEVEQPAEAEVEQPAEEETVVEDTVPEETTEEN